MTTFRAMQICGELIFFKSMYIPWLKTTLTMLILAKIFYTFSANAIPFLSV